VQAGLAGGVRALYPDVPWLEAAAALWRGSCCGQCFVFSCTLTVLALPPAGVMLSFALRLS
jgi:hypothetical protein